MKVKISYQTLITKEIELTPIEFRGLTVEMYLDELPIFAE